MRNLLTSVAELASAACVIVGASQVSTALAWVAAGAFGLWFARAASQ
jgi:hypothetical protein